MTDHKEWLDFYGRPLNLKRYLWRILNHVEFLYDVIRSKPRSIIEIGIGTASHCLSLSHFCALAVGIDDDLRIVKSAVASGRRFGKDVKFVVADAFKLPFKEDSFDLCLSQGFFEHFGDNQVNELVDEQLRVAPSTLLSVPSHNYRRKDYGNERLLTTREWLRIVRIRRRERQVVVRAKYSFVGMRALGFLMLRNYRTGALEVLVSIRRLCQRD
jgi:hypothetical protein